MSVDILAKWYVTSDTTASRNYTVSMYRGQRNLDMSSGAIGDISFACSCPAWTRKKGPRKNCKHIVKVNDMLHRGEVSNGEFGDAHFTRLLYYIGKKESVIQAFNAAKEASIVSNDGDHIADAISSIIQEEEAISPLERISRNAMWRLK